MTAEGGGGGGGGGGTRVRGACGRACARACVRVRVRPVRVFATAGLVCVPLALLALYLLAVPLSGSFDTSATLNRDVYAWYVVAPYYATANVPVAYLASVMLWPMPWYALAAINVPMLVALGLIAEYVTTPPSLRFLWVLVCFAVNMSVHVVCGVRTRCRSPFVRPLRWFVCIVNIALLFGVYYASTFVALEVEVSTELMQVALGIAFQVGSFLQRTAVWNVSRLHESTDDRRIVHIGHMLVLHSHLVFYMFYRFLFESFRGVWPFVATQITHVVFELVAYVLLMWAPVRRRRDALARAVLQRVGSCCPRSCRELGSSASHERAGSGSLNADHEQPDSAGGDKYDVGAGKGTAFAGDSTGGGENDASEATPLVGAGRAYDTGATHVRGSLTSASLAYASTLSAAAASKTPLTPVVVALTAPAPAPPSATLPLGVRDPRECALTAYPLSPVGVACPSEAIERADRKRAALRLAMTPEQAALDAAFRQAGIEYMLRHLANLFALSSYLLLGYVFSEVSYVRPHFRPLDSGDLMFVGVSVAVDVVLVIVVSLVWRFAFSRSLWSHWWSYLRRPSHFLHWWLVLFAGYHVQFDIVVATMIVRFV